MAFIFLTRDSEFIRKDRSNDVSQCLATDSELFLERLGKMTRPLNAMKVLNCWYWIWPMWSPRGRYINFGETDRLHLVQEHIAHVRQRDRIICKKEYLRISLDTKTHC